MKKTCFCLLAGLIITLSAQAQRTYQNNSVLASGAWYKLAVKETGIYKIDLPFLASLGINTSNISSSSIRIYGNGGQMLPEACAGAKIDDLQENAVQVSDGGDGIFNNNDYLLFYANGPQEWVRDSANQRFNHKKNLYSDQSYYFLSIGGTGQRIAEYNNPATPNIIVNSFKARYFYELDTINFLNSGKNWYGEELSNQPGQSNSRTFAVPFQNIISGQGMLVSNCIGRSIGAPSRFQVSVNGSPVLQQDIQATSAGNYDEFAKTSQASGNFPVSGGSLNLTYQFQPANSSAQGWLDWFEIFVNADLSIAGANQLLFRDWNSVATGNVGEFRVKNAVPATRIWDITDPLRPVQVKTTLNGSTLNFTGDCGRLHEYIAFTDNFLKPLAIGPIANQDLHRINIADLIIVVHAPFIQQAQRIASFHQQHDNLSSIVVTADQVYNEFSSGSPEPTAIRDFVKMYYDRNSAHPPKYLLLLGDASFDFKNRVKNNTNFVPSYQSNSSLSPLSTYVSDDYFGFLNDPEDINSISGGNLLDVGIGRVPARTIAEATAFADKLLAYHDKKSLGPWRNDLTFIADDEDFNLHLDDAEIITGAASVTNNKYVQDKIYLDAFHQESSSAGSRYPTVNQAINDQIQKGTLIWNYNGHGGFRRLAEEVVLEQPIVDSWNNPDKLPLFITATCDFAPFDNPGINSLGENILLRNKTGAIALMTTTRLVFAFSNRIINENYLKTALQQKSDGSYYTLGDAVKIAKNVTYQTSGDDINNRKFTLLGDPAMTLAFPQYNVQTNTINGHDITVTTDTLRALQQITITGKVTDQQGNTLNNFNGDVYPVVFDKPAIVTTLANDAESLKEDFTEQKNIIFKGKSTVNNGNFSFSFVVPKDINYQFENGMISYYADNGSQDANGVFTKFIVGGSGGTIMDTKGPDIKVFLNDESFSAGSTVNETPLLLLQLADTSGINVLGTGIGHDITAILDGDPQKLFVLNDFFVTDLDSYKKGTVRYQLPLLQDGNHSLKIKAWDAANNSSEVVIEFRVNKKETFILQRVLNYPNPFSTSTTFCFELEYPEQGQNVDVVIQLFNMLGQQVKSLKSTINMTGKRSCNIVWDGRDDKGNKMGKGVYIYVLQVKTPSGKMTSKVEKIYLL